MADDIRCDNCVFFVEEFGYSTKGRCHATPPVAYNTAGAAYPLVSKTGWCGYWTDKDDGLKKAIEDIKKRYIRIPNDPRTY